MTVSPEARRAILVGAYEEDAVFDLLALLTGSFGGNEEDWLEAIREEARQNLLAAYRYGSKDAQGETTFVQVELASLELGSIGRDYIDPVYLARTNTTVAAIRALPPPPPGHPLWITGLWGRPPTP